MALLEENNDLQAEVAQYQQNYDEIGEQLKE